MRRRRTPLYIPVLLAYALLGGCGESHHGDGLLGQLRHEGLIIERLGEAEPSPSVISAGPLPPVPSGDLTLETLFDLAEERNPRIAAARAAIGVAGGRAWQATLPPNPSVGVESENIRPLNGGLGGSETTVGFSQPLVVGNRLEAAAAVGVATVEHHRALLDEVRRGVRGEIRRVVTRMLFDRRSIELHQQLIESANETLRIAASRFEARAAPESEAIRARVEVNGLSLAIDRLRGDLAVGEEQLTTLLGGVRINSDRLRDEVMNVITDSPLEPLDRLTARLQRTHPAIRAAGARVDAAREQVGLEQALSRPDIDIHFGIGADHADDEGFFEAGVSLPLRIFDRNQGSILAARFEAIQLQHEANATSNELVGALAEAHHRWESARARASVFDRQILAGAERSYEQTLAGYEAGKFPFLDLLDAQRTLTEARLQQMELSRSVNLTLCEIFEILGDPLESPATLGEPQ